MNDLQKIKEMKTPYLCKMQDDLKGSEFKGHHITVHHFNVKKVAEEFVDSLVANIKARFSIFQNNSLL